MNITIERFDKLISKLRSDLFGDVGEAHYITQPFPVPFLHNSHADDCPARTYKSDTPEGEMYLCRCRDSAQVQAEQLINEMIAEFYERTRGTHQVATILMPVPNKPLYWYYVNALWTDNDEFQMTSTIMDYDALAEFNRRIGTEFKGAQFVKALTGDEHAAQMIGDEKLKRAAERVVEAESSEQFSNGCEDPDCVIHGRDGVLANARRFLEASPRNDIMTDGIL